jgi:hypothetical protein
VPVTYGHHHSAGPSLPSFFRSRKSKRIALLPEFYALRDKKAHQVDSPFRRAWLAFLRK